jgi:DNA-binding Lrp family transcriptional regulator
MKLSAKELKLLYNLDINCRLSAKQLARESGYNQSIIQEKIKKLEEQEIITKYETKIDYTKSELTPYRIKLEFENIPTETYKNFQIFLEEKPNILETEILDINYGIHFYQRTK